MPGTHYRLGSLALLFLSVSSCGSNLDPTIADDSNLVTKMSFGDTPPAPLSVGETTKLTAYFFVSSGSLRSAPEVTYVSSNPAVATVVAKGASYDGIVTAVSPGTTTITATCCTRISATVVITVSQSVLDCQQSVAGAVCWKLDGTSVNSAFTHHDGFQTVTGTVTYSIPPAVKEGSTYTVTATFTGTVTMNPGVSPFSPYFTVGVRDYRSLYGTFDQRKVNYLSLLTTTNPTITASVTATGSWTIPSSNNGKDTVPFVIWGWSDDANGIRVDATYRRVR